MVLRKPPPPRLENLSRSNARPSLRSPTSPSVKSTSSPRQAHLNRLPSQESIYSPDLNTSPAFDLMPLEEAQKSPVGSPHSHLPNSWSEGSGVHANDGLGTGQSDRVPPVLVPGPQQESTEAAEGDVPVQLQSNNPFLKAKPQQPRQDSLDPNQWNDRHSHATTNSDPLSQTEGYIPMTARLSLLDSSEHEHPWTEHESSHINTSKHVTRDEAHGPSPWGSQHSIKISAPQEIYLQGGQPNPYAPAVVVQPSDQRDQDPNGLQPSHNHGKMKSDPGYATPSAISSATSATSHELIDLDDRSALGVETGSHRAAFSVYSSEGAGMNNGNVSIDGPTPVAAQIHSASREQSLPTPNAVLSVTEAARQKEQRAETYSIRQINWKDQFGTLLQSPILVQNENGPCPLLALVNALVLRANPNTPPPIVKALRTREQISLGLLIEALFEELTMCLGPDEEFPDIEALTQFLTMLHTGMNVNPCLTLETSDSLGTFLQTNDLRLYSTFGVPLIHGWVASWSSQAHAAMNRTAQYHEDIQLLPFSKQAFEDRVMHGESLSSEEEQKMADIQAIQQFVDFENATQLSPFGLTQLTTQLAPGSVSILFRNDHFSTLYKHPQSHQLYSLVTDAGYANHAEVVWESLVDVTGFNSEFFAGDFRVVGDNQTDSAGPASPRISSAAATSVPKAPNIVEGSENRSGLQEQSDADYAYALSLQFQEEEQREQTRSQQSSNRRTSPPSRNPAGSSPRMSNPPDRSSSIANGLRSSHARQGPEPEDPNAPPPPYEQAASGPRYSPPDRRPQRRSHQSGQYPGNRYTQAGRYSNGSAGPNRHGGDRRNSKDCIVM